MSGIDSDRPMESWTRWLAVAPIGAYIVLAELLMCAFLLGAWLA